MSHAETLPAAVVKTTHDVTIIMHCQGCNWSSAVHEQVNGDAWAHTEATGHTVSVLYLDEITIRKERVM